MNIRLRRSYLITSIFISWLFFNLSGCAFKSIRRTKNSTYLPANASAHTNAQELNIFAPRKTNPPKEVFIFIHGGNWNSGRKEQYNFLGSRMARKGAVTVILDYPLSPGANYHQMVRTAAQAVVWVQKNIWEYGGNPNKIFVGGHSAGGHLSAILAVRHEYFESLAVKSPIKGAILIDAAGLDMYGYLQEQNYPAGNTYLQTFTTNPAVWKAASPLYHLHQNIPPLLIYRGENTYPSIIKSNEKFIKALQAYAPETPYRVEKGKKHVPMITQFLNPWNPLYAEIIHFMRTTK
jgi:acetyl esterase/lipase